MDSTIPGGVRRRRSASGLQFFRGDPATAGSETPILLAFAHQHQRPCTGALGNSMCMLRGKPPQVWRLELAGLLPAFGIENFFLIGPTKEKAQEDPWVVMWLFRVVETKVMQIEPSIAHFPEHPPVEVSHTAATDCFINEDSIQPSCRPSHPLNSPDGDASGFSSREQVARQQRPRSGVPRLPSPRPRRATKRPEHRR